MGGSQHLFRTKALERIASPEKLDQLMPVVGPKDWLPLVVLGSLVVLAIVWSVAGRVTTVVSARGVLTHPRRVIDVETLGSGRLEMLHIKTGDVVHKGDVIAYLDQSGTRRRLEDDRAQPGELRSQDQTKNPVQPKQSEAVEAGVMRENLDGGSARQNQMQGIKSRVSISQLQVERTSTIQASSSGRILEVFVIEGQIVSSGTRIATIEEDDPEGKLINVSYFSMDDGKKIQPGMSVQVTPDSVERQRFGGITGVVTSVSALPVGLEGSKARVGNADVAQMLMQGGPRLEVLAQLDRDPGTASGYRWSSSRGPSMKIDAGITDSVRVTVENRTPITYLLPFLREITGVY